ncbi:MAG TPA: exonuclease domain-containing protein [Candidatus Obscuribacterales bacterium]
MSDIANVVDVEHDNGRLIEIGLTTVSIKDRAILQSYSLPIAPDFDLSPEISHLTGWTSAKLRKQGITKAEAIRRLAGYGFGNRLLVSDASDEIPFLEEALMSRFSQHRLNVSILFSLTTGKDINLGLEAMLAACGLNLEGRLHSAADDSRNIARLFLLLLPEQRLLEPAQSPIG